MKEKAVGWTKYIGLLHIASLAVVVGCLSVASSFAARPMPEQDEATINEPWFKDAKVLQGVLVENGNGTSKPMNIFEKNGLCLIEGDIIIGQSDKIKSLVLAKTIVPYGGVVNDAAKRWPNKTMPYLLDAQLSAEQKNMINEALQYWRENTALRFSLRSSNQPNYVRFRTGQGCSSSSVGMRGGEQFITLGPSCTVGNVKHEIGHAVGLMHEHIRTDRDSKIDIDFSNVEENKKSQFRLRSDEIDKGNYDYGSIMHYGNKAFAVDKNKNTITPTPDKNVPIGQRRVLSSIDKQTINSIYP